MAKLAEQSFSLIDDALSRALAIAGAVPDPEIPAVNLADLGIVRGAERRGDAIIVKLTPTYTGCPATAAIAVAVEVALREAGLSNVRAETVLTPAWSTDDITDEGREKLRAYGIAPPERGAVAKRGALFGHEAVCCPRCGSRETERISEFGSTPCKSLWRCVTCREPFDYFKCL